MTRSQNETCVTKWRALATRRLLRISEPVPAAVSLVRLAGGKQQLGVAAL
jgi:hypothetical protein